MVKMRPHPNLDPDKPIEIELFAGRPLDAGREKAVRAAMDSFVRFSGAGAFPSGVRAITYDLAVTGDGARLRLSSLPSDPSALGIVGRILLTVLYDLVEMFVSGSSPTSGGQLVEALPNALERVPSLRDPLSFSLFFDPGATWYAVDVSRHAGITLADAAALHTACELWLEICRVGAYSEVADDLSVVPGDIGFDTPQLGEDFWAAQIAANDVRPDALSALVNMIDQSSRSGSHFDEVMIT